MWLAADNLGLFTGGIFTKARSGLSAVGPICAKSRHSPNAVYFQIDLKLDNSLHYVIIIYSHYI
jgi:hypothetical protein